MTERPVDSKVSGTDSVEEFLVELLDHGTIVFRDRQLLPARMTPRVVAILEEAFHVYCLSIAGPPIPFHAASAFSAAEVVRQAAWAVVNREERADKMARRLVMSRSTSTASAILSCDMMLRYLPSVLTRARGIDYQDPLIAIVVDILRRHPLSGVLADIDEGPLGPLEFEGHQGLCLLYAERLTRNDRPAWRPADAGLTRDCYELALESLTSEMNK